MLRRLFGRRTAKPTVAAADSREMTDAELYHVVGGGSLWTAIGVQAGGMVLSKLMSDRERNVWRGLSK